MDKKLANWQVHLPPVSSSTGSFSTGWRASWWMSLKFERRPYEVSLPAYAGRWHFPLSPFHHKLVRVMEKCGHLEDHGIRRAERVERLYREKNLEKYWKVENKLYLQLSFFITLYVQNYHWFLLTISCSILETILSYSAKTWKFQLNSKSFNKKRV